MSEGTNPIVPPQELDELASAIRTADQGVTHAATNLIEHALAAGDALHKAKEKVGHGAWLSWLKRECDLSEDHAERYMRIAQGRTTLEANSARVRNLSLAGALKLLGKPNNKRASKSSKPDLLSAWHKASREERTAVLNNVGIANFLQAMPPDWYRIIRAEAANPDLKLTTILRKALSLIKTANAPGMSAAMTSGNTHEALSTLQQLTVLLVRNGADLNDITLSVKAAPKSRRRVA